MRGSTEKAERQVAELSSEIGRLKAEVTSLAPQAEEGRVSSKEVSHLQGVVKAKDAEIERLTSALQVEETARREATSVAAALGQTEKQLHEQVATLQSSTTQQVTTLEEVTSRLRTREQELRDATFELQRLAAEVQGKTEAVMKLETSGREKAEEVSVLKSQVHEAALEVARLKQALQGAESQGTWGQEQVEKQRKQLSEAEERGREAARLSGVLESKEGQLKQLTQQLDKLVAEMQTEQRARQEAEVSSTRLTQRVQILETEERRLLTELEQVRQSHENQVKEITGRLKQAEEQVAKAEERGREAAKLSSVLESKDAQLKQQIQQVEEMSGRLKQAEVQLQGAEEKCRGMELQAAKVSAQLQEREQSLSRPLLDSCHTPGVTCWFKATG